MKRRSAARYRLLLVPFLVAACGGDSAGDTADLGPDADDSEIEGSADVLDGETSADVGTDAAEPSCDDSHDPIVMAHGFLASGDTWSKHTMRFGSNGWCTDRIYAFDWNTLDFAADNVALLDAFIDDVLERHGAEQVDLVGHSAGGGLGYEYLAVEERAAKVAHYAHVGSFRQGGPAGPEDAPVPTLNLWSPDDAAVDEGGDIDGATNVSLPGQDHYKVATSVEAFAAMYEFFTDGATPQTTEIVPEDAVQLSGRVVSLGENQVPEGASVEAWPVSADDGTRTAAEPAATWDVGADGAWGPFDASPDQHYEFRVTVDGGTSVSYYREPQPRSNPMIYLRTLPSPGSMAGVLVSELPFDEEATVLVVFSASSAVLAGEDSLTVDGTELLDERTAPAENTTIALFAFDDNGNGESDDETVALFDNFPFLSGLDFFLAGDGGSTEVALGDRVLHVVRRPGTEGATIAVFD